MARAKKLPSGSWRVQVYTGIVDGKRKYISITAPTEKEANYAALQYQMGVDRKARVGKTVGEAIDDYIAMKDGVLSPTTIQAYKKYRKSYLQELMDVPIKKLTMTMVQTAINEEAKRHSRYGRALSPKTLRNAYGLLCASVHAFAPTVDLTATLPARQKHMPAPMLSPERVVELVKGTEMELPVLLAMWLGLSMSEIRGIDAKDIRAGVVTIDKAVVDIGTEAVEKPKTKAYERTRTLTVPPYIRGLVPDDATGKAVRFTGNELYRYWTAIQHRAGIDRPMRFHDLRHLNASVMLALGVPDKYAMERGGWSTPHVMKSVYQHTISAERESVDRRIDDFFSQFV